MAISSNKQIEGDETIHHQSPSKKKKKKGSPNMQPPMTPMIDVTFQLLLFFILTCEFRESEGMIPGTLPDKGSVSQPKDVPPPPDPITIKVFPSADRNSATYEMTGVGMGIPSVQALGELLKQRVSKVGKEVPIMIHPKDDVPWGFVVEAFNQAKIAQFEKIGFAKDSV